MPSSENSKLIRIFRLIQYLCSHPAKNVDKLAGLIQVSHQTLYRYISILKETGYDIESDHLNRYSIKGAITAYQFEPDEKKLIAAAINHEDGATALAKSVLNKLDLSAVVPDYHMLRSLKQLKMIQHILMCIEYKLPLTLINYQSTTLGSKERNREILPLYFDEYKLSITGLELTQHKIKIFKLTRMDDISPSSRILSRDVTENLPIIDIFGVGGTLQHKITLQLTVRARTVLTEEYPASQHFITSTGGQDFPYIFEAFVSGYEGIGRFVMGLLTEIKVIADDSFKLYLQNMINNQTILKN